MTDLNDILQRAHAQWRTGHHSDAAELYGQAVKHLEECGETDSPRFLVALQGLAESVAPPGRANPEQCELALSYLRRALDIVETTMGACSERLIGILCSTGSLLVQAGREREALPYMQRALAVGESVYGCDHRANFLSLMALFNCFMMLNAANEAMPLARRLLQMRQNAAAYIDLALCLKMAGQLVEAREHFAKASDLIRLQYGENAPDRVKQLNDWIEEIDREMLGTITKTE